MIITIHQPEHLPWLGFIHKALSADVLVLLDNVQFRKNYFQNRNKIRTASKFSWLTVPVQKHSLNVLINEARIDSANQWQRKSWKTLYYNYRKAPCFSKYSDFFEETYNRKWELLVELNIEIIRRLLGFFKISTKLVVASDIKDISGERDDLLLSICRKLEASEYLSGISGKDYLDKQKFADAGITVSFQEFYHPIYQQCYQPFIPCMSSIDLLFNHGGKAREILLSPEIPRLDHVIE